MPPSPVSLSLLRDVESKIPEVQRSSVEVLLKVRQVNAKQRELESRLDQYHNDTTPVKPCELRLDRECLHDCQQRTRTLVVEALELRRQVEAKLDALHCKSQALRATHDGERLWREHVAPLGPLAEGFLDGAG